MAGSTYIDGALPIGLRSAPIIFNALVDLSPYLGTSMVLQELSTQAKPSHEGLLTCFISHPWLGGANSSPRGMASPLFLSQDLPHILFSPQMPPAMGAVGLTLHLTGFNSSGQSTG